MAETFDLRILTPAGITFEGPATSLQARGRDGYFGVLAHHTPLVAALRPGHLMVRDGSGRETWYEVGEGVIETAHNKVNILADHAEPSSAPAGR